jgi:hypothetical protein
MPRGIVKSRTLIEPKQEKKAENRIVYNLSGPLRTLDIAGYIASLLTNRKSAWDT